MCTRSVALICTVCSTAVRLYTLYALLGCVATLASVAVYSHAAVYRNVTVRVTVIYCMIQCPLSPRSRSARGCLRSAALLRGDDSCNQHATMRAGLEAGRVVWAAAAAGGAVSLCLFAVLCSSVWARCVGTDRAGGHSFHQIPLQHVHPSRRPKGDFGRPLSAFVSTCCNSYRPAAATVPLSSALALPTGDNFTS